MRYPNRDELVRMGLAAFAVYLGVYYWDTISGVLLLLLASLRPVALGCVIAYIANIPMRYFERKLPAFGTGAHAETLRRTVSLLASLLIVCTLAGVLLRFIAPELMQSMRMMSYKLPAFVQALRRFLQEIDLGALDEQLASISNWDGIQEQISQYLMSGTGGFMGSLLTGVSSALASTFEALLSAILAIYILMSKEQLGLQLGRLVETYCGPAVLERVVYVGKVLDHSFSSFIIGRCISSLIVGVLCTVGMMALRLPYAMTIGTVVGVTNIVPVVGPFVGGIIGTLLIFSTSTVKALMFIGFVLILQQLDANVIFPRVVGSSTGLPGIWVLAAVAVGGGLGGIPAILLSVPVAAALYRLIGDDLHAREVADEAASA